MLSKRPLDIKVTSLSKNCRDIQAWADLEGEDRDWAFLLEASVNRKQLDDIMECVNTAINAHGYECIEAEWVAFEKTLRLFVDCNKEGSVTLDDCVAVNSLLRDCTDLDDRIPGAYNLEVSSPGIERPLRRPDHFLANIGKKISVRIVDSDGRKRRREGRLEQVSENGQIIMKDERGDFSFPLDKLDHAHIVFDWDNANLN